MHFRPLHDRVLVRRIDAEEKTAGGIIIPDTAKEKPQEGEIVAAGAGGRSEQGQLIPIGVKPGDRVVAVGQLKLQSGSAVTVSTDQPPPIPARPPRY